MLKKNDHRGIRWHKMKAHYRDILDSVHGDRQVYYESVNRHLGTKAAHVYGGCLALLEYECCVRNIECVGVPVTVIKKFATGKGNADKQAMIAAAQSRWPGIPIIDDNHADALWIALYGLG